MPRVSRKVSRTPHVAHRRGYELAMLVGLALLGALIYANSLAAPFVFDDHFNITNNPAIRLTTLSLAGLTRAAWQSYAPNRPVANISFALNYYVHEYEVAGYHIVNIGIHIATGLLLYLLLKTTLRLLAPPGDTSGPWIAGLATLLWLTHPLHTQSVTYIVQRMNSLAALFYLSSLLLYIRARLATNAPWRWLLYGGCAVAGILALGCKEIAITLPVFILLYEWYFLQRLSLTWLRRYSPAGLGVLLLLGIAAYVYVPSETWHQLTVPYHTDMTIWQRVLTELRVLMLYVRLWLFPHPSQLHLDRDFPISHGLFDPPGTLLALLALLGMLGGALSLARREPLLSFAVLWFFGNLVLESAAMSLEIVFEHRTYLPSVFLSVLVVTWIYRLLARQWLRVGICCTVGLLFAVWTYERNRVWANEIIFWSDNVAKAPAKARPHSNLADALARQGRVDEAIGQYTEALRLSPTYVRAHNNLGDVLERQGRTDEAIRHYMAALELRPDFPDAHNNLANALMRQGRLDEAISHHLEALRLAPTTAEFHYNLGSTLARQGRLDDAVRAYTEALRLQPNLTQAYNNLGNALARQGRLEEAVGAYREALRMNPGFTLARTNLERILRQMGPSASPASPGAKP